MSFRVEKNSNLDYLQADNVFIPGLTQPVVYLNSVTAVSDGNYVGTYGNGASLAANQTTLPVGGNFTRVFANRTNGASGNQVSFTVYVNDVSVATTSILSNGPTSGQLTLTPSSVPYKAGDRVAVLTNVLIGPDPIVSLALI